MANVKNMDPIKDDIPFNKIINMKTRPKPEIIESEALKKSIEILSKYDYVLTNDEQKIEEKICFYCKNKFPALIGKNYNCQSCDKTFCVKHRDILNHHCIKLNPNLEKYLNAKNIFKEKMRMLKMKGLK